MSKNKDKRPEEKDYSTEYECPNCGRKSVIQGLCERCEALNNSKE